jgi:hypothetical protein
MKNALLPAFALAAAATALCSCTMNKDTVPGRSASEQMELSTAADRAADKLAAQLSSGGSVFIDTT